MSQMNLSCSNVAYYSIASEKVFEMNIDSLKKEIENFGDYTEIQRKRSETDLDNLDKMLENIIFLEASKKQINCNDYEKASSFICKYN